MKHIDVSAFERIEGFINDYHFVHCSSPTIKEIAAAVQMAPATVDRYLHHMTDLGLIQYFGHRRIKTKKMQREARMVTIQIRGTIQC